jgi:hypothetical protein
MGDARDGSELPPHKLPANWSLSNSSGYQLYVCALHQTNHARGRGTTSLHGAPKAL